MGLQNAILFSLLAVQTFAAPNGCIDSCTSYHRTYQTQNGYQDHAALTQPTATLSDLAYVRPGNWTEENHYRTDGGHGNLHEERGQYETGPKRVRYYKKNYTASYSSGNTNGLSESELNRDRFNTGFTGGSQQLVDTQRGYNQYGNTRTTAEQHEYNRIHSERTSHVADESQRLEDFGTYGGNSRVSHHSTSGLESHNVAGIQQPASELPSNWSRVDSYKTDDGHGRVHEEEGQYVTGPKKVRYFKRNYTSSYTSGGIPTGAIPEDIIPTVRAHDIQTELQKLQREFGREIQHLTNTAHRETGFNSETTGFGHTNVQPIGTNQQVISSLHRNEEEHVSTSNGVVRPYVNPTQRVYSTENHNSYERREGYRQPERQYVSPTSDYSRHVHDRVSSIDRTSLSREEEQRTHEQLTRGDIAGIDQTNSESLINSDVRHGMYGQQVAGVPSGIGQGHHYREHWSSASHTREGTFPPVNTDSVHQESSQYNRHQQYNDQRTQSTLGHANYHDQLRHNNYHSGYRSSDQLATGVMDIGHAGHTADCTEEHAEQVQYGTRYHRNYKRSANYKDQLEQKTDNVHPELSNQSVGQRDLRNNLHAGNKPKYSNEVDDLTEQTTGRLDFGRHPQQHHEEPSSLHDFSQQSEHDTQIPSFPSISKPYSDFSQQPVPTSLDYGRTQRQRNPEAPSDRYGDLEQQNEDLGQVSSGFEEFGRYPFRQKSSNGHLEDLTETGNHDFTQQSHGGLEFGQSQNTWTLGQNNQRHRGQDFSQRDEDFTQQTGDFDDLTQQSGFDDFSQQTGNLEFEQQTRYPGETRIPEISSQHRDDSQHDFTQQTGKFEFGQEIPYPKEPWNLESHHRDNLSQQSQTEQTAGKLEFGQESMNPSMTWKPESQHRDDLTQQSQDHEQQSSGKLEFGQETQNSDSWMPENHHRGDLSQQTQDLTQQSSGKLEFDQTSHHSRDETQQWDDLSQQSSGKLELGQQTENGPDYWKPVSASQHREDLSQQTGDFDDLSQQTSGKLELGQQTQQFKPWDQFGDLTEKNKDQTQQTSGNFEFERRPSTQINQQNEDLSQQTGHFEFGQSQQTHDTNQQTQENTNIFQQNDNQRWKFLEAANLQKQEPSQQTLEFGNQRPVFGSPTEEPAGVLPVENQFGNSPQEPSTGLKPAEKPKPRPRYSRPVIIDSSPIPNSDLSPVYTSPTPSHDHPRTEDLRADQELGKEEPGKSANKEVPMSAFDTDRGNSDQVSWLHKSNDATVGLQWHYNYHPSDLTNSEPVQNSYYPHMNYNSHDQERQLAPNQEHSQPITPDHQESEHRTVFDNTNSQLENQENSQINRTPPTFEPGVKGHRRPNLLRQTSSTIEPKLQPRILEAYGGGPYDSTHNEDIYSRVTPNPSATLPPLYSEDPWDIREKPREPWGTTIIAEIITDSPSETMEPTTTETPPSFWGRLGHKITNTFDKARDKARGIFG